MLRSLDSTPSLLPELMYSAVSKIPYLAPYAEQMYVLLSAVLIVVCAFFLTWLGRRTVQPQIRRWVGKTSNNWDDYLFTSGFFSRLNHLLPAAGIYVLGQYLYQNNPSALILSTKIATLYLLFIGLLTVFALLNAIEQIYNTSRLAKRASITGFIQIVKLATSILAFILGISLLIDKNPFLIVSGFTALAAVLMLIFRDTILGFVAGIQITANRMFTTGDWIQISKFEVDGEILELGLTNVKVQNWDKTISTLPTYSLTNESVKNWRGMQESGGRRIKRAIYIDMHSVKLVDATLLARFQKIRALRQYIEAKVQELRDYHHNHDIDEQDLLNKRKLTNIGTFRAYLENYLRQHESVNQQMTLMVRQLAPTELGLPLEIYCFSATKEWIRYEQLQADIFDHVLAMMPFFDLRPYQRDAHLRERVTEQ